MKPSDRTQDTSVEPGTSPVSVRSSTSEVWGFSHRNATKVSIIVACRNEAAFIADCLESILANDYPKDLVEVLVVDGMSDDGTRRIVERYCDRFAFIKLLDNPRRIASAAFNLGVQKSSGDRILIMGAHNAYAKDYISRCVRASNESGADNVGGVIRVVPRTSGLWSRALALTLSHRFGVGNSHFRCTAGNEVAQRRLVDTVFGGCYRREAFERVGPFNEKLVFNQDIDFNLRLRRAGGRILLDPSIVSEYRARSDVKSFWKHNFRNGSWVILSGLFSEGIPFSGRHLVPLLFVLSSIGSAAVGLFVPSFFWMSLGVLCSYLGAVFAVSCVIAWRQHDFKLLAVMPVAFASLHVSYGLGSFAAVIKTLTGSAAGRPEAHQWQPRVAGGDRLR